jgi:hypothetical protein
MKEKIPSPQPEEVNRESRKTANTELTLPNFERKLADIASMKKLIEWNFQRFDTTGEK